MSLLDVPRQVRDDNDIYACTHRPRTKAASTLWTVRTLYMTAASTNRSIACLAKEERWPSFELQSFGFYMVLVWFPS